MNQKKIVLEQLNAMGFDTYEISEVGYLFNYEDINYLYMTDDDEKFLRIAIPNLFDVTDENRIDVLEAMHDTAYLLKYAKVCIMNESSVWALYEHYLSSSDNLTELLEHIIMLLEATAQVFHKKITGEEVVGRSDDSDELTDEHLEEELQKIFDGLKDEEQEN